MTEILDTYAEFVLCWPTYFWSIPGWIVVWSFFMKLINGHLDFGGLGCAFILSLFGPFYYFVIPIIIAIVIVASPFIYIGIKYGDKLEKLKNKKIL